MSFVSTGRANGVYTKYKNIVTNSKIYFILNLFDAQQK